MSSLFLTAAMSICFVAGKSGGHLLPCITQATNIQKSDPKKEIYIFTSGSALDHAIVDKQPQFHHVTPTSLDNPPYQKPWLIPWFACKTAWYFVKAAYTLWRIKPEKVISLGGFVSVPTCLAAKLLSIPFDIYELNVEPGKATMLLSKFTDTVHICFGSTRSYFPNKKCVLVDYPIRFTPKDREFDRADLLAAYQFQPNRITVLILGGSQGSILLNEVFKTMIEQNPLIANQIQVIHQTGTSDGYNYQEFYDQHGVPAHVFGYCQKLQDFYNLADIIISRAGAGTVFEIQFFNKKCITIPHETANTNHQIKNVLELQLEHPEQFQVIKQSDFTPETLKNYLTQELSTLSRPT